MRLFLALELEPALRQKLVRTMEELRAAAPDARWARPEGLHLTLCFLGETPAARLPGLKAELARVREYEFELTLQGWGFFPSAARPRVFWAGVAPQPNLMRLHELLRAKLESLGWPAGSEVYTPHLTLARARAPRELYALRGLTQPPAPEWGRERVREFVLFESRSQAGQPHYLALERFALQAPEGGAAAAF